MGAASARRGWPIGGNRLFNRARLTHEIALDVQNVTNRQNVFSERYDVYKRRYATEYQLGLFPISWCRLTKAGYRFKNVGWRV